MSPSSLPPFARRAFAAALFVLSASLARAQQPERVWNQPRGNSAGTAHTAFDPVLAQPVVAWKQKLGTLSCEPVSWAGVVYVVAADKGARKLYALDLETGNPVAKPGTLPFKGDVSIAVWQGTVCVLGSDGVSFFTRRGNEMGAREKRVAGSFPHGGVIASGFLFATDGALALRVVDIGTLKPVLELGASHGRPSVLTSADRPSFVVAAFELPVVLSPPLFLSITERGVSALGSPAPTWDSIAVTPAARIEREQLVLLSESFVTHFESSGDAENPWLVYAPALDLPAPDAPPGSKPVALAAAVSLVGVGTSPIVTPPAVVGARAFGFSRDGELIALLPNAKYARVIPPGSPLPAGARPGPATAAGNVLYLGNWAVELASARVLWCDPELDAASPLLPLGDARLVYIARSGELVCLADPNEHTAPVANAEPRTRAAPAARPTSPDAGDGVVLASGERVAGAVTRLDGGRVRVAAGAESREFARAELALIANGATVELAGRENSVFVAFGAVHRGAWLDALEKLGASWREVEPSESHRLLVEADAWGLDGERSRAWARSLTGKAGVSGSNADKQRTRVRGEESAARTKCSDAFVRASVWCAEHGLALTAAALLVDAERIAPDGQRAIERALTLVPSEYPGDATRDRARAWSRLSRALLAANGAVVPQGDAVWERARTAPWDAGTLALRTENVLVFSRDRDPDVLGSCLVNADRTVRVLAALLPVASGARARKIAPLDVRIHATRAEFLAEAAAAGAKMDWAAGYYAPFQNVSRFFVPRAEKSEDPLQRDLASVLVHELTHHYVSARWLGDDTRAATGDVRKPGFWIVEGFARFIEDQVVEMDRRGERLDDDTVMSIDASAALSQQEKGLIPLEQLLQLSQMGFAKLTDDVAASVQLRNTLVRLGVTQKTIFYEQSGSLVYFLMNVASGERRARVLEYLRAWYAGKVGAESWKMLGYESAAELQVEYDAFLAGVRKR